MSRRLMALLAMGVMLASMLAFSASAFADKGGAPHDPSCGTGRSALLAIDEPMRLGASEISLPEVRPQASGCPPPQQ